MDDYKLTRKGKIVLSAFILILLIGWLYSGLYILNYFGNHLIGEIGKTSEEVYNESITDNSTENTIGEEKIETHSVESTTESLEVTTEKNTDDKQESDGSKSNIYSVGELEDLKLFKIIIYYNKDLSKLTLNKDDQQSIFEMLKSYPNEVIAVSGYINGYPNFNNSDKLKIKSLEMANGVKEILVQSGLEATNINVYGYGTDYPISKDYGNQEKNNRVEIYFENHYVIGSQSK